MHERFVVAAAVSAAKTLVAGVSPAMSPRRSATIERPYSASRILDTTQIRRLSAFASAADVTIQHFHGAL